MGKTNTTTNPSRSLHYSKAKRLYQQPSGKRQMFQQIQTYDTILTPGYDRQAGKLPQSRQHQKQTQAEAKERDGFFFRIHNR